MTKIGRKCQKWLIRRGFDKPEAYGQTVLPDRSILIGQKLVVCQNWKIQVRYFEGFSNIVLFFGMTKNRGQTVCFAAK